MAYWAAIGQIAGEVGSAWLSSDSAHKANRMNLRLQRENQAWMKDMSNTAIQRRAADIEAAGGNRALAFVNGSEATTPTTTPARMEPVKFNSPNIGSALLLKAQVENTKADTVAKLADGRQKTVDADIAESLNDPNKRGDATTTEMKWQDSWNKLARQEIDNQTARSTRDLTASQLQVFDRTKEALIQMALNDAKTGDINREALENYAKAHGLEAERAVSLIGSIVDAITKVANPFRKNKTIIEPGPRGRRTITRSGRP